MIVLFLGTVTPVYFLWFTPELFNLALVTGGLVAWSRDRPALSAVLLGLAAYSKPTNLMLALPLGLAPFLERGLAGLGESLRRGGLVAAVVLAGFGLTWAATGEANYQGGERKTFYDRYPFESPDVNFDSAGIWMTTDHLGPLVAGRDDDKQSARVAPPRPSSEIRESFLWNLAYFWTGRFGGALPYFAPAVLAAFLFLLVGPRDPAGGLALGSLVLSFLVYLWLIPDNWYGGGGTLGNRYFVNLLPLALFFVPRGRAAWIAGGGVIGTAALLLPVLGSPVVHSLAPGRHATTAAFRAFPLELTMLGDLSIFTDVWRKRRPYHHPERRERHADEPAPYYLWFPDDGTYGQESSFAEEGFWLRGGQGADVVVQALRSPGSIRLRVTAGPAGDIVTVRLGRERKRIVLNSLRSQEVTFEGVGRGLGYYQSSLYLLRLGSRFGGSSEKDPRPLGSVRAGRAPRLAALLLAQQGVEPAADLGAPLDRVRFQQLLAGGGGDGQVLAGEVHPRHGLRGAALLVEERAQVGVRVQVAGEGFHRGSPVVAGVALVERLDLGDERVDAHELDDPSAAQAVELHATATRPERDLFGERGHGPHRVDFAGGRVDRGGVALRDREQELRSPARDLHRSHRPRARDHDAERGFGKEAQVLEGKHGKEVVPGGGQSVRARQGSDLLGQGAECYTTGFPNLRDHFS